MKFLFSSFLCFAPASSILPSTNHKWFNMTERTLKLATFMIVERIWARLRIDLVHFSVLFILSYTYLIFHPFIHVLKFFNYFVVD